MGKDIPRSFEKIRSGEQILHSSYTNLAAAVTAGATPARFKNRLIVLTAGGTGGVFCVAVSDGTNWRQMAVGANAI